IEYRLAGETLPAPNTTPESLDLMRFADTLRERGGEHLISEVSSHALAMGRVHGFRFHTAVFTNLTRGHLDYHKTMGDYASAKRLLFAPGEGQPRPQWAVLNADDPASASMADTSSRVIWYGVSNEADLKAENIRTGFSGLRFDLVWQRQRQAIESPLLGS